MNIGTLIKQNHSMEIFLNLLFWNTLKAELDLFTRVTKLFSKIIVDDICKLLIDPVEEENLSLLYQIIQIKLIQNFLYQRKSKNSCPYIQKEIKCAERSKVNNEFCLIPNSKENIKPPTMRDCKNI